MRGSEQMGHSRRDFLAQLTAGAGAAWVAANWPTILAAHDHAQRAAQSAAKFEFFTAEQATEVEAITAQIIPTDETPGACEARVIYFIDRALTTFQKDSQKAYQDGLAEVAAKVKELFPSAVRFSALGAEQQVAVLKAIEKTPFFGLVRLHTVLGFVCDPSRGGNFNRIGWQTIGFEDAFLYTPPFGYYDKEWLEEQKKKS